MRHIVRERGLGAEVAVDSAGTYAGHTGELPDARMRRAASRRGYELTHRARQIREEDFGKFDMIVVMDDRNYEHVHRLAPSRADAARIFRMREFFSRHPGWDHVPDPYYEGAEGFELVLDMLEDGCEESSHTSGNRLPEYRADGCRCHLSENPAGAAARNAKHRPGSTRAGVFMFRKSLRNRDRS